MPAGVQELLALAIVAVVVGFALYRRSRRRGQSGSCGEGCGRQSGNKQETTIHFYRRQDD